MVEGLYGLSVILPVAYIYYLFIYLRKERCHRRNADA